MRDVPETRLLVLDEPLQAWRIELTRQLLTDGSVGHVGLG